jgi:hypothetical protein
MRTLRLWIVLSWIALPTVLYGGYSLLRLINHDEGLIPFQATWFRAGHAHAGVLLLMSLLYYVFLDATNEWIRHRLNAVQRARATAQDVVVFNGSF